MIETKIADILALPDGNVQRMHSILHQYKYKLPLPVFDYFLRMFGGNIITGIDLKKIDLIRPFVKFKRKVHFKFETGYTNGQLADKVILKHIFIKNITERQYDAMKNHHQQLGIYNFSHDVADYDEDERWVDDGKIYYHEQTSAVSVKLSPRVSSFNF